jgi:SAM-dependent methyltransferase
MNDDKRPYRPDLAYIHDVGYGGFARNAAPGVLDILRRREIKRGLVVDLGCGSGIWARGLCDVGFHVLGIDISEAMIAIARERVPEGEFRSESFLTAEIPPCVAVTSLGECFSYLFDRGNTSQGLLRLFRRIHQALHPGGVFIFDVVAPGRVPGSGIQKAFREGQDWAILVEVEENRERKILTRRIVSFRKVADLFRRDEEIHRQRLFTRSELAQSLRSVGFRVHSLPGYGDLRFPRGVIGFLARKPND